jgi:type IV pilus assembly protein PilM
LVLRHIQIPLLKPKETAEAVEWEARRVLPFPVEDAQVDWLRQGTTISDEGETQDILLVAVRDNIVQRYVEAIKDSGLHLVALDAAPMALGRWLLKNSQVTSLIIDLGAETTQLHFFDKSRLIFSRSVSIGGSSATQSIQNFEGVSLQDAETLKLRGNYKGESLESWLGELGREIQRSLEYFRTNFNQDEEDKFGQVLLTGGASSTRGVEDLIRAITGVDPGYAEFSSKARSPRHDKIVYNVALGAGMWEG